MKGWDGKGGKPMTSSGESGTPRMDPDAGERAREGIDLSRGGGEGSMSIIRQLDQLADRAANKEKNNRPDFRRIYNSFLQSQQTNTLLKRKF